MNTKSNRHLTTLQRLRAYSENALKTLSDTGKSFRTEDSDDIDELHDPASGGHFRESVYDDTDFDDGDLTDFSTASPSASEDVSLLPGKTRGTEQTEEKTEKVPPVYRTSYHSRPFEERYAEQLYRFTEAAEETKDVQSVTVGREADAPSEADDRPETGGIMETADSPEQDDGIRETADSSEQDSDEVRQSTVLSAFSPSLLLFALVRWGLFALVILSIFRLLYRPDPSSTTFDQMTAAVSAAADLSLTEEADNQMFRRLYGLVPSDFEGVLLYAPKTNMGAEELLLIHLYDASQETDALAAVQARKSTQLKSFDGYGIDQTAMLEKSIITSEGNYILYYSGENPESVLSAFEAAL